MRTEFGVPRSVCQCEVCLDNCRHMPGYLVPSDLERMIPANADPYRWAETNLLASHGAIAMKDGEMFRIPTLVPAVKPDGSCIHLSALGLCQIHEVSPFGCAYFDCGPEPPGLNTQAMVQLYRVFYEGDGRDLYFQLHLHLRYKGLEQVGPEILRQRMANETDTDNARP